MSLLEATAASQLRTSSDIFSMLRAISLDVAKGDALDRIGAEEQTPRLQQIPATGFVTISDTSFEKISTKIFQGAAAPIIGSTTIKVADAEAFDASGNIYIGRGTANYEGPIPYTSITAPPGSGGNYWLINLTANTLRFHNIGESVILAQGGDRLVGAGSIVQTTQGGVTSSVQFKTVYSGIVLDGETSLSNVLVVATKPGTLGNVPANAITNFASAPFTGAVAANPSLFSNGQAVEKDDPYRDRIRKRRASKSLGTKLAIQTYAVGVTSLTENKRVTSASVVTRQDEPTVLYIDDGTGYEEQSDGVAIEHLVDLATGGEQYFNTSEVPVEKASSVTSLTAPFALTAGGGLAFKVGGIVSEHTFDSADFDSISSASAYEVCASINKHSALTWQARTAENGTKVAVFAKTDTNEDVQNVEATIDDQNGLLGFPDARIDTIRLYRNGILLSKDGQLAQVYSNSYGTWTPMSGDQTMVIEVDGIELAFDGAVLDAFSDQDFVDAETGFTTLGKNTPTAWAAVFNYRVPGITASVVGSQVVLTSNRGRTALANITIKSGTLVSNLMFADGDTDLAGASTGKSSDYTLNRNTGEIKLLNALAVDEDLQIGELKTQAFIQTPEVLALTYANDPEYWFVADGEASLVEVSLGTSLTLTETAEAWGDRQRLANTDSFINVQIGDYVIFWDANLDAVGIHGAYRVSDRDDDWVEIDLPAGDGQAATVTLANAGVSVVHTDAVVQKLTLPAMTGASFNIYTAETIANYVDSLENIAGTVYRTNYVRISTDTIGTNGDIALVARTVDAQSLDLDPADATVNQESHVSSVESGNSQLGPILFRRYQLVADATTALELDNWVQASPYTTIPTHYLAEGIWNDYDSLTATRWGNNRRFQTAIEYLSAVDTVTARTAPEQGWLEADRLTLHAPYLFTSEDNLTVLVDNDTEQKRFDIPMWRSITPTTNVYAQTNDFTDTDNGGQSLTIAFGYNQSGFDFNDFAAHMRARVKYVTVPNTDILWRYSKFGPDGDWANITYANPESEDADVAITVDNTSDFVSAISVHMPSAELLTGYTLANNYPIGVFTNATVSGLNEQFYIIAYKIISYQRTANVVTIRLEFPTGANIARSGLLNSTYSLYNFVTASAAPSGTWDFNLPVAAVESEWVPASGVYDKIVFTDVGVDIGLVAGNVGAVYFTVGQTASFADGSDPALDTYYHRLETGAFGTDTDYDRFRDRTMSILNDVDTDLYWIQGVYEDPFTGPLDATDVILKSISNKNSFKIFKNSPIAATDLADAVNALTDPIVTGTYLGSVSTGLTGSSAEYNATSPSYGAFADGVNYIRTTTVPVLEANNYSLTFKNLIAGSLGGAAADWENEEVRLVPTTAKNVVDWLNALGVSGLSNVADITQSSEARKVQIATQTPGSAGSVEVQGGPANTATAAVLGSAIEMTGATNFGMAITVDADDAEGFMAYQMVRIDNAALLPKAVFDATTEIDTITAAGLVTFDPATPPLYTARAATNGNNLCVSVEQHGGFVCYAADGLNDGTYSLTNVSEGDWVRITQASAGVAGVALNGNNVGIFRVIRTDETGLAFWIENSNAVEQSIADADFDFYTPDSVMPGDTLKISTNLWGDGNEGTWTITSVGPDFAADNVLQVDVSDGSMEALAASPGAIGTDYPLIQVIEASPVRLYKGLWGVWPSDEVSTQVQVRTITSELWEKVNASAGSVLTTLNKLDFPLTDNTGIDGYRYNTGLLQEVNRVEYGDLSNPTVYPGVVAAGGYLNIQGPLVKRVKVSLLIRTKLGFAKDVVATKVKSAAAGYINSTPVGTSVSISGMIAAVQKVVGIETVVVLAPIYGNGNDLITAQPYEKLLVLNTETDILVSFQGS